MHVRQSAVFVVVAVLLSARGVSAQAPASTEAASVIVEQQAQASVTPAQTPAQQLQPQAASALLTAPAPGVTQLSEDKNAPAQPVRAPHRHGPGFGLMVAGGALFVAGLLVGGGAGTAMAIGGAVVGAYGLYVYFE